jgi:GPH family glycoside/pentoside/hexuronide:cation symporter
MDQEQSNLFESLRAAFKNPPFLLGMGIFLGTWIPVDIAQAILLYFIKYCVLREKQSDLIMGTIFVTAIIALPLWNWIARRWNKRLAYITGIAFWAIVQMIIITLGPSTPLAVLLALCALAGIGVAAAHVIPWSILPDAIEWDEWKTGKRHEGMFYSIVTLSHKVAASIAIPLVLLLLDAFNYEANVTIQQPRAELAIRLITGPIPAVLLCLGILCAVFYPLTRERYDQIVRELEKRRAAEKGASP